jgi:hypothetical protein
VEVRPSSGARAHRSLLLAFMSSDVNSWSQCGQVMLGVLMWAIFRVSGRAGRGYHSVVAKKQGNTMPAWARASSCCRKVMTRLRGSAQSSLVNVSWFKGSRPEVRAARGLLVRDPR